MDAPLEKGEGVDRLRVGAPWSWRSCLGVKYCFWAGTRHADIQDFQADPTNAVDRAGIFSLRGIEAKRPARN